MDVSRLHYFIIDGASPSIQGLASLVVAPGAEG